MRGGIVPPAMLCLALGLALAFVPRRVAIVGACLLVAGAVAAFALTPASAPIEAVFLGCWASVIVTAATTYLPRVVPAVAAALLAVNAGGWAGAVSAVAGTAANLAAALAFVLVFALGGLLVARGWSVALKVVASWLIAIATLAAMLPLTPTPGYVPDHME